VTPPERVAVVDIGTNTLLLLIVERCEHGLVAVHDESRFGRLGKGLDKSGAIATASLERSLAIVADYRTVIDELGVSRVAAVGTQALREASNAAAFVTPAQAMLGVDIEVIAGEREAELVFRAVASSSADFELGTGQLVVADVGGGSTEIIIGDMAQVSSFTSLEMGSVRHTERHLCSDPPSAGERAALDADIDALLGQVELPRGAALIGTGGTAANLAAVDQALTEYDAARIHGYRLSAAALAVTLERFMGLSIDERRSVPGLEPERADVIAAGVAIYARLFEHLAPSAFIISDRGVRWGLAHELTTGTG
jgi:exopolyphosphatase/guanosine-5'-triphosphate,3'-diphosphate pyrophosphatase